jgi:hypothetical protein
MKKGYCLIAAIFLMFLLLSVFAFAGSDDAWEECSDANDETGEFNHEITIASIIYYCCTDGTNYFWQTSNCGECTDEDGDYYIKEGTPETDCGNMCGPDHDEECIGNDDCVDSGAVGGVLARYINPGATEMCNNVDDDCDILIDEDFNVENCWYVCMANGFTWTANGGSLNCCGNDANEDSPYEAYESSCDDGNDNDCDGLTDMNDQDCGLCDVSGNVKNTYYENVENAKVTIMPYDTPRYAFTNSLGNYQIEDVLCGNYDMTASASGYIPSTKNVDLVPHESIVDFTLAPGETCEDDCTYAGSNTIHKECDGINGCSFCDERSKEVCDLAQPGWIREYDATHVVECAEGCPAEKQEVKASVTCEGENLIKVTKVVSYKGKLVRLIVITCG